MPSSRDWFRSTTWDDSVAAEFERRLQRARPRKRAEYVRIQATHLSRTGDPRLHDVARSLFRRVIDDFPEDRHAVKGALEQLAQMLVDAEEYAEAEELLRRLVDLIDTSTDGISGTSGNVELTLAEVIIAAGSEARLGEASSWLDRHEGWLARESFYDVHFRHHLARARVAGRLSAPDAADHARSALEWANRTDSPFANHPDLGFAKASRAQRAELDGIIRSAQRRGGGANSSVSG